MSGSRLAFSACLVASLIAVSVVGCGVYTFTGGGGLPSHIKTMAVLPFENETTQFTLTQELTQTLTDVVPGRLGVQAAPESSADAIMRGTIVRYQEAASNYQPDPAGPIVFQRRVDITISVEIFDTVEEEVIWSARSLSGTGEYLPESQIEAVGRQVAIDNLVTKIIDGAQSQW
jgi:hypothetical protein